MSVEATTAAWARRDMTPTEKIVLLRIADHANPDGGNAWPSINRVSDDTGLSERAVRTALRSLERKGALVSEIGRGPRGTNRYSVVISSPTPRQEMPPAGNAPLHVVPPAVDAPGISRPKGGQELPPNLKKNYPKKSRTRSEPNADVVALCDLLAERIAGHTGTPKPASRGHAWTDPMRLLLERGPTSWEQPRAIPPGKVRASVNAVFNDLNVRGGSGFCWADVIQSPSSLRKHWDKLHVAWRSQQAGEDNHDAYGAGANV